MPLVVSTAAWQNRAMAAPIDLAHTLAELRRAGRARNRRHRAADIAMHLAHLLTAARAVIIEDRHGGTVFRLTGDAGHGDTFSLSCSLRAESASRLTAAEIAVIELLCEGRTRAQIAHVRGVSENTVKSQIRQLFRKLDVESRVALVRRWCP